VKRAGDLLPRIASFANLEAAYRAARRGKRGAPAAQRYTYHLERQLWRTRRALLAGRWRFGPYRSFTICDTKPRRIVAAPFADRVVHHAICRVIEPVFDARFIHDSYACRAGRGNLAAVHRFRRFIRARPAGFVLHCDVARCFQSVDHAVLLELLQRKLKDKPLLALLANLVRGAPEDPELGPGKGIPIGNLTSQLFANVYLDPLDHFAKQALRLRRYLRYVDDFVAVHQDKAVLHEARDALGAFLSERLRRRMHPTKATVRPVRHGTDLLGYRIWPDRIRVRRAGVRRFVQRERGLRRAFHSGVVSVEEYWCSVDSWLAFARHADSSGLVRRLGFVAPAVATLP